MLFALELDRRSREYGLKLLSAAAHPGVSYTKLQTTGPSAGKPADARHWDYVTLFMRLPGVEQSAAAGSLPTLMAATSADTRGGAYVGPAGRFELVGPPAAARIPPRALDTVTASRLWTVSQQMTGTVWLGEVVSER